MHRSNTKIYIQRHHGFVVGNVVYKDGDMWVLANSSNYCTLATHLVVHVLNVDEFTVASSGVLSNYPHNLGSNGSIMYVSSSVSGTLTSNPEQKIKQVFVLIHTRTMIEIITRIEQIEFSTKGNLITSNEAGEQHVLVPAENGNILVADSNAELGISWKPLTDFITSSSKLKLSLSDVYNNSTSPIQLKQMNGAFEIKDASPSVNNLFKVSNKDNVLMSIDNNLGNGDGGINVNALKLVKNAGNGKVLMSNEDGIGSWVSLEEIVNKMVEDKVNQLMNN